MAVANERQKTGRSAASGRSSNKRQRPGAVAQRNGALMTAGLSALSATVGVAGGVLLGRTALRRGRKVLGVPMPSKIELGDGGRVLALRAAAPPGGG